MGQVVSLPHHRRYPRIDERRHAPGEEVTLCGWFALAYALGLVGIIAFAIWSVTP